MTPKTVSKRVVTDRLEIVDELLKEIRALPFSDRTAFFADRRNIWSAESCLRRSLEALFDIDKARSLTIASDRSTRGIRAEDDRAQWRVFVFHCSQTMQVRRRVTCGPTA